MYKLLIFFLSFLFIGQSNLRAQQSASKDIQVLLDSLEIIMTEDRIPGALISIVTSDSIYYTGGIGFANVAESVAVTDQHLFRLGSISKTMTCLAIMRLVEQDKLSLTTPIMEIDPSLPIKNVWRDQSPILVEHLLEHTAGFDDMHFNAIYNTTDDHRPSCREMINVHQKSLYARWEPGTYMSYANPGYVVAGHIIEKVSGKSFDQFIKEEVLDPVGMPSSGFYFKEPTLFPMAIGYESEGGKFTAIDYPSIQGGPAGELCANAADMAHFLQFMLNRKVSDSDKQLISNSSFDRMESAASTLAAKRGLPGGYGLAISNGWRRGYKSLGHNGGIDGFVSDYLYLPEANFAVAVSVNSGRRTRNIVNAILEYFVEEVEVSRQEVPIPQSIKDKYDGFYTYLNPRNQLFGFIEKMVTGVSLTVESDSIIIKDIMGNKIDTWFHAGGQQFYTRNEGVPFSMVLDHNKTEAIWVDGGYAEKESKVIRWTKNILFGLSLLSIVFYLIYGVFAILIQMLSKDKRLGLARLILWIGSISFVTMLAGFISSLESIQDIAKPHAFSILTFVSSVVFLVCAIVGFVLSFKSTSSGAFSKWYFRITAILMLGLALFLLRQGIIGIRLWTY